MRKGRKEGKREGEADQGVKGKWEVWSEEELNSDFPVCIIIILCLQVYSDSCRK